MFETVQRLAVSLLCAGLLLVAGMDLARAQTGGTSTATAETSGGPIRLRQPLPAAAAASAPRAIRSEASRVERDPRSGQNLLPEVTEFEQHVQRIVGTTPLIRRFGADLMAEQSTESLDAAPLVPADYLLKPGDELLLTLWGSVDADMRLQVDRSGRVTIPRVGPVALSGVRYADLPGVLTQRVSQVFRNFQLSVSLSQLRGQRVYVTGFVNRPGAYVVSGLSSVAQVLLAAGGPSTAGSYRNIEVRRGKERIATLDLYDILMRGDRSSDRVLQGDDVVHVGPVGGQVAVIGSVNRPGIFEMKPQESLGDLLAMAGGLAAVADPSRVALEQLDDRASVRIVQVALPQGSGTRLAQGTVVRAFSAVDVALPVQRQNKRVRVEGEVLRPGEYVLPPASTVADALAAAGGLTPGAFVFGTEFSRESVRLNQQQNYDRALRDLETELARAGTTQRAASDADEAAAQAARAQGNERLLTTLRNLKPNGRIVLQLQPGSRDLPALALEDGDRLYVPARPTTVGVFGSVFNGGSYLHGEGRTLSDYLGLAGGPTRGADESSTFVIRANGSVVSRQQEGGWLANRSSMLSLRAEPGDTVFVPEELNKTTFIQNAKDWTQILYQFGLGVAGLVSASR
jgi:protein involved in polysaccharide export with SLBB domain